MENIQDTLGSATGSLLLGNSYGNRKETRSRSQAAASLIRKTVLGACRTLPISTLLDFLVARRVRILLFFAGLCRPKLLILFVFNVAGGTHNP
jgi:hypothetical protein